MDSESLNRIIRDSRSRQFWIVLWGIPGRSPDEGEQIFDQSIYDHGFSRNIDAIMEGDLLFVHRIGISKLIYVGEVVARARMSTVAESDEESWRQHWKWSVTVKNLTPEFGKHWRQGEKTFTLAHHFNELRPQSPVKISRIKFGSHVQISREFADFLLTSIMNLGTQNGGSKFEVGGAKEVIEPQPRVVKADELAIVSADQLADWRRKLIRCLVELEKGGPRSDVVGVAERISRLQRCGVIPRETAAMMRVITEMGNAAEDQGKQLSAIESKMVFATWDSLREWAQARGLQL